MTSANSFATELESVDGVYETTVVSYDAVSAVENTEHSMDSKTFFNAAEKGWRVGQIVPRDSGTIILFVKMEARK